MIPTSSPLLRIQNLSVSFQEQKKAFLALDNVHLIVKPGEILGIIGESASGKTTLALSILKLLPHPHAKILTGHITYKENDILNISDQALSKIRGKEIAYIFQDATQALDPVIPVFKQISTLYQRYHEVTQAIADEQTLELLKKVGIENPLSKKRAYPHELSGGLRQRIGIAIALSGNPKIIIADEPTSALDPAHKKQIIDLLLQLKKEFQLTLIFITHEIGLARNFCDHALILYAGQIVETGPAQAILKNPQHPYTKALLNAYPSFQHPPQSPLYNIPGNIPPLENRSTATCQFLERCPYVHKNCHTTQSLIKSTLGYARCWRAN